MGRPHNHVLQDEETRASIADAAHRIQGCISRTAVGAPDGQHATAERKWLRGLIRRAATKAWIAGHGVGASLAHDPKWCRHVLSLVDAKEAQNAAGATSADSGWCYASDANAETWTCADSRDNAIARGRLDYPDGFVVAPGRRIAARDLAVPNGESFWEDLTSDDMEVGEEGMERLVAAPTEEEVDDLGKRIEAVIEAWLTPIAARCGWWMVDAERAEEIEP
jgi:hypothetical protein